MVPFNMAGIKKIWLDSLHVVSSVKVFALQGGGAVGGLAFVRGKNLIRLSDWLSRVAKTLTLDITLKLFNQICSYLPWL